MDKKEKKPFQCTICRKRYKYKKDLETHKEKHTAMYTCELCNFTSNNKQYVARHTKRQHVTPTGNECEFCGKRFHFKSKMMEHRRTHTGEKPNQCKVCGRAFNTKFSMNTHMLIHENLKPFKCSYCDYACRDCSSLRKHETIHTGLRPVYRCKQCDRSFLQRWRLKIHVAEDHMSLDVRKFECGECGAKFKVKALLRIHMKNVHQKSTACECKICGKIISAKANIYRHMAVHVDVRPYKCNQKGCSKQFKDPSSLRKHKRVHLNLPRKVRRLNHVRKVECDYCNVRFLSKNYLKNHIWRKHLGKAKKLHCDMCEFVTHNKPSLVMHIKYGHVSESDRKCKICKTTYKRHMYLKAHYARTHGIRYKTKKKKIKVEIKEEPDDAESIDLFEIEKEELLDDLNFSDPNQNLEQNVNNLETVPKDFYERNILHNKKIQEQKPKKLRNKIARENAQKCINKLLVEVRLKEESLELDKVRQMYNDRMKKVASGVPKEEKVKIKYFNNNKPEKQKKKDANTKIHNDSINQEGNEGEENNDSISKEGNELEEENDDSISKEGNEREENDDLISKEGNEREENDDYISKEGVEREENDNSICKEGNELEEENDDSISKEQNEKRNGNKRMNGKLRVNGHQCYICFKLFETKDKLIHHCKYHFDVCHEVALKKCPICQFVTNRDITRHLRLKHKIKIKLPSLLKDKGDNSEGSRYYYDIKNSVINKMEIIPSIKNLNKIAYTKIDKKNRENKDKTVTKTKLIKKSGEWIVVKEKIDVKINDLVLPKINTVSKLGKNENYMDRMRNLYHAAKKEGRKILFPCENCDKVCQTLAALKLHSRKHDPDAKPFKPKVWKHKGQQKKEKQVKKVKKNTTHRHEKPKPIVNNHKCDDELKEFYEKNIRGGDIEFWQFLKIYNRMSKENVKNFEDLETRSDFGIHIRNDAEKVVEVAKNVAEKVVKKVAKKVVKNKNAFKRVVRISKSDYLRRNAIKNELRKKIANDNI